MTPRVPSGVRKPHRTPGNSVNLWRRLALWRAGLNSSVRRYSRDVLVRPPALQARLAAAVTGHDLAERWRELPQGPGLAGAAWLGHCTVLLRMGGLTILTDPVLSPKIGVRVGPVMVGPRRLTPAIPLSALPQIDLILLSHSHFDHFDKPTLRRLASPRTRVVTAARTAALVPPGFGSVHELDWGGAAEAGGVVIEALKPRHWGARAAWDRHRGYNSYLLTSRDRSRVLFAGDTAHTDAFDGLGPLELAIMGIGAYDPWEHAHATPEQALLMATAAQARYLLPVHHSTFRLSDEPAGEPMARLLAAARPDGPAVLPAQPGQVLSPWPPDRPQT